MSKTLIVGATGFTGTNIARELLSRGHEVVGLARHPEANKVSEVTVFEGSVTDEAALDAALDGVDTVILATKHAEIAPGISVPKIIVSLAQNLGARGIRLGVIGGAGSLYVSEGDPRLIDTPAFPDEIKGEASAALETLVNLQDSEATDWFLVSPSAMYGSFAPGERRGTYREALDTLIVDADGNSAIGGEDFATAVVDEIEQKKHHNRRFTIGY